MSVRLVACPSCSRHVRIHSAQCPFCASALPVGLRGAPARPGRRYVGKTATALYLTALATAGCGAKTGLLVPDVDDVATDDRGDVLDFDGFMLDAGTDTSTDTSFDVPDSGGSNPVYK